MITILIILNYCQHSTVKSPRRQFYEKRGRYYGNLKGFQQSTVYASEKPFETRSRNIANINRESNFTSRRRIGCPSVAGVGLGEEGRCSLQLWPHRVETHIMIIAYMQSRWRSSQTCNTFYGWVICKGRGLVALKNYYLYMR